MNGVMMIYVLLPAYNEEHGIGKVLEKLCVIAEDSVETFRIVVVDDGSIDYTSDVVNSFNGRLDIKLIQFEKNLGVAEVFKNGYRYICEDSTWESNVCVVLDADDTQCPKTIDKMVKKIREGNDIVIASRFQTGGNMIGCPALRLVFSYGISWLLRMVIGLPNVKDYSTFYRAYRVSVLKTAFKRYGDSLIKGIGFSVNTSFLLKLANITNRICEVPSVLRYDAKMSKSGNRILKTIFGYLKLIYEYWTLDKYRKMS